MDDVERPDWLYPPGSDEAVRAGCACPRMDNNNGRWPPFPPDGWWIVSRCPLHQFRVEGGSDD